LLPNIALLNRFYLGDGVLLEPIATKLSEFFDNRIYIISNYPELYENHPCIIGLKPDAELPESTRVIDMSDAIASVVASKNGKTDYSNTKLDNMYLAAGLKPDNGMNPLLYLSQQEQQIANQLKTLFQRPRIGIAYKSRKDKNYPYIDRLAKRLSKEYDVFLIHDEEIKADGYFKIVNQPLRNLMSWLSMMDLVVGCDTGLIHLASALDVQTVVILYNTFYDLYKYHHKCVPVCTGAINRFSMGSVKVGYLKRLIDNLVVKKQQIITKPFEEKEIPKEIKDVAIIRMRGIGDVIMSLFAVAQYRKQYPDRKITYVTSIGSAKLVALSGLCDSVIGIDYDHATSGNIPLPKDVDFTSFDKVYNLMNKIDFGEETKTTPRIELFCKLLEVSTNNIPDISLICPDEWREKALLKLGLQDGSKVIVLQADSKGLSRGWPIKRQNEFINMVLKKHYISVIVSDIRHEGYNRKAINLTGRLVFEEFVGLIDIARCIVSPDSSSVHIAGILNKPIVALFGSIKPELRINHYNTIYPIVGKSHCVPCNDWQDTICDGKLMCMNSISGNYVWSVVETLINLQNNGQGVKEWIGG